MRRTLCLPIALALCASCVPLVNAQASAPPPGPPLFQMRSPAPSGDRLAGGRDAAALYSNRCGACHLPGGMGTNLLTKQRTLAGAPPESGLLTNRRDLSVDYVKTVVRGGKRAMPGLTRVELTDAELDAIAAYLAGSVR